MSEFHPLDKSLWLHKICEANFRRLLGLVPDFERIEACATAEASGKPPLHWRLLERSSYTLTVELTHDFSPTFAPLAEPAVRMRVCMDSRTVEMLSDHERPTVLDALQGERAARAVMDYKWKLNYFLARWLDHCLASNYRFETRSRETGCLAG